MSKLSLNKPSLFRRKEYERLRGNVDDYLNYTIRGWAWDTSRPNEAITVEARTKSGRVLASVASEYRADLENAGFGNGRHGFRINISEWGENIEPIGVYVKGTNYRFAEINPSIYSNKTAVAQTVEFDPEQEWAWHIDDVNRLSVYGWIVSRKSPSDEIAVFIKSATGKEISTVANLPRGDLVGPLFESINHAFNIDVSSFTQSDWPIDLVVRIRNCKLNKRPLHYNIVDRLLNHNPENVIKSQIKSVIMSAEYLSDDKLHHISRNISNSKASIIFQTANPQFDKEGLISKFLQYESFRIDREKYEHAMSGVLQERIDVLMWYLIKYLRDRQYKYILPLSSNQIEFLNSPMPIQGYSPVVTIALYNIIKVERQDLIHLDDPNVLRQALYWWCCERAPRDKLDQHLVTSDQIAFLSREEQWSGESFAFNAFAAEYFARHVKLHSLNMHNKLDRAIFFYYLILKSWSEPFILRFLSKELIKEVLNNQGESQDSFNDVVAHLSGLDLQEIKNLSYRIKDMEHVSVSSTTQSCEKNTNRDIGECYVRRLEFPEGIEPGVAVIGPLHKTSGLGQATRLSYEVLEKCESVKPTGLAFDLDNPAPVGFTTSLNLDPYKSRREINIIHLNAESVPLLYAFGQNDIVDESYNIGYFFWELNMIPKCHYLSLELLDEIWVSSEYNREIYARYTDKPVINVGMAVEDMPSLQKMSKSALGFRDTDTVFLTTFDSFSFIERKNPMGVLEAFRAAFPLGSEPVRLVLKTQNRGRVYDPYQIDLWRRIDRIVSNDQRIVVINETYHYKDLLALKQACDCYVSLHRAEGWGFGMIEAMQLGKPVIATAYSGNMDFCIADTTYLVDYDLIGVREAEYIFVERGSQWAHPSITHAAERMREVVSDRVAAEKKGEAAAKYIKANFSVSAIASRYAARLEEIRLHKPK
ncbi:glycosyltransferase [Methylobacterium sp. Gmos1]